MSPNPRPSKALWDYHVRIPCKIFNRLEVIADRYGLNKAFIINLMIEQSLPKFEELGSLAEHINGEKHD